MILTIIAIIVVLLFLGVLFLVMVIYYNNKRKQLERDKQAMKDMFERQLLLSQLEIQEQAFNIISQEIHDNVGQTLSVAKLQLNIMHLDQQDAHQQARLQEVKDTLGVAMNDLRDIAKSLSSDRIRSFDLGESIAYEVMRINNTGHINCIFSKEGIEHKIMDQVKLILFRIIQECLQNIIKHGNATEVSIVFNYHTCLEVSITDNGVGFDPKLALGNNSGLGLQNILSRAKLVDGDASIKSEPGKGTTVKIQMPYA